MPAGGLQALRRRIRSVQNTAQITRAMKIVAGAELRRAEERARRARDYFEAMQAITARAVAGGHQFPHPLLVERPVNRVGMLVVSSDRGLAGPFNANIFRQAMAHLGAEATAKNGVIVVGRKGRDFFRFRGQRLLDEFVNLGERPSYADARSIADAIVGHYLEHMVDVVYVTYMQYVNPMVQKPRTIRLLPVERPPVDRERSTLNYTFEPEAEDVFEHLLPRYLEVLVYGALLESKASEQGARMMAMDTATKNAEEMIRKMTLQRNRLRQAAITREIAELVGGAEAMR